MIYSKKHKLEEKYNKDVPNELNINLGEAVINNILENNINEKHGVSANLKDNQEEMKGSKILQGSIIIKSMRRNSSYNIGKSMRQKKPSIHVSNE